MRRRLARVLAILALVGAVGCQDYNFNPVGHCYIQPGTKRVRLADVATADILFVVDDSGSMAGEQTDLATNFDFFVNALNATNTDRVSRGLDPIDFHIAVTTTSVYLNISTSTPPISSCSTTCTGASGAVCCLESNNTPLRIPKECPAGNECSGGYSCRTNCDAGHTGEPLCCDGTGAFEMRNVACRPGDVGDACGDLRKRYLPGCTRYGQDVSDQLYPHGDFVAAPGNAKVLHFDDALYTPTINTAAINALMQDFKENVVVGTCGSGQEQGLQAARLAIQKALSGAQQGVAASEWPHPNSKLVVAFIGDEDDCSGPEDPGLGVVIGLSGNACTDDTNSATPKQFPVSDFSSFLTGLGRPLGTAFMVSAYGPGGNTTTCEDFSCQAGQCCGACGGPCTTTTCGGQQGAVRFLDLRDAVGGGTAPAADIVAGSICDPSFGTILQRVADIVKPPQTLQLPSAPATSQVTVLRVVDKSGLTKRTCRGPAPAGLTSAQATAQGFDWWFVASTSNANSVALSQLVFINHATNNCEANPGETYSADYLGVVPPPTATEPGGCTTAQDCTDALGPGTWTCEPLNPQPAPGITGTCLCGA